MYDEIKPYDIDISDGEILRYLGYNGQEMSKELTRDIQRCKEMVITNIFPRYICAEYGLEKKDGLISLNSIGLILPGKDIAFLLEFCESCLLMAATIGSEVDRLIAYHQKVSINDAVILDAVATAAIEAVCAELEARVKRKHKITMRYSCGYGDLPVDVQPHILSVLNTQKMIGLYCNDACAMTPRKSVTAIIGMVKYEAGHVIETDCKVCRYNESCVLQKGDKSCGNTRICKR